MASDGHMVLKTHARLSVYQADRKKTDSGLYPLVNE